MGKVNLIFGDMFDPETYKDSIDLPIKMIPDALVITTNGYTKADSRCVMGRGVAMQAARRYPHLALKIGKLIKIYGNGARVVSNEIIGGNRISLIAFPVKPIYENCLEDKSNVVEHMKKNFMKGNKVPGWACKARFEIIQASLEQLLKIVNENKFHHVVLPYPGTGAGELPRSVVAAYMQEKLDERFYLIDLK